MKLYKECWGMGFEFECVKEYILFTLGRVCGFVVFYLMLEGFFYYIHTQGYIDEPFPIAKVTFEIIKLFI